MFFGDKMNLVKSIVWAIASSFIVLSGILFTVILRFPQFKIVSIFKGIFNKEKENGISSLSALMLTLGGRIGVGSVSGVALAIYYGGIGSIFWMWFFTIICASNTMAETVLGIIYSRKDNECRIGGPSYYLEYGLNKKKMGVLYAILILFSYIGGFLSIQTNTIITYIKNITSFNYIIISIMLIIVISVIIFGGIIRISKFLNKIVPFMTLFYLFLAFVVALKNMDKIPIIFLNIIKSAFSFKPFFSGFLVQLIIGLQRGIFSNESGVGTSVIASSTVNSNDYKRQGYIQILGVYITTLLICTSTAIIILCSNYNVSVESLNGIEIVEQAFKYHFDHYGNIFLFFFVFLFSLSTILTGYYYGESSFKYLIKTTKKSILFLKIVTLVVLFLGCIIKANVLWNIVDILVGLLCIINIYALLKLKDVVKNDT